MSFPYGSIPALKKSLFCDQDTYDFENISVALNQIEYSRVLSMYSKKQTYCFLLPIFTHIGLLSVNYLTKNNLMENVSSCIPKNVLQILISSKTMWEHMPALNIFPRGYCGTTPSPFAEIWVRLFLPQRQRRNLMQYGHIWNRVSSVSEIIVRFFIRLCW